MGAHASCALGFECRCPCHAHTQALVKKGAPKPDARGGVRRKQLKQNIAEAIEALPPGVPAAEEVPVEVYNSCPKCKTRAKPTDQFCRKDGTRLCIGKPCPRCEAPCEEEDAHCWQCGWKLSDQPPVQETVIASPAHPELAARIERSQAALVKQSSPGTIEVVSADEAAPAEDPITRLRRLARDRGLLSPGSTPS
jgi:hypothetical protein